jgi:hypothetical protein
VEFILIFSRMIQSSDLLAASTELFQNRLDATLIDNTHPLGGHAQRNETLLGLNPETMVVQVRQEAALGAILGVRNIVTGCGPLTRNLTDT